MNLDFNKNIDHYKRNSNIDSTICIENTIKDPYITIAIPTYKRKKLLEEAIESALIQKSNSVEYEIIVIDNEAIRIGSTETSIFMEKYRDEPRVSYYRNNENLGMYGNWNRCFELARGNWVALLHDDDLLKKNYLNRIVYYVSKKKKAKCICVAVEYIKNNKIEKRNVRSQLIGKTYKIKVYENLFYNGNIYGAPTCGTIFNRSAMLKSGGFSSELGYSADWFGCIEFNEKYPIYKIYEVLGYYRWEENESLKVETQIELIEEKKAYQKFCSKTSIRAKIWLKIFGKAYEAMDLKNTFNLCLQYNIDLKGFSEINPKISKEKVKIKILHFLIKNYTRLKTLKALISK